MNYTTIVERHAAERDAKRDDFLVITVIAVIIFVVVLAVKFWRGRR